MRAEYSKSDIVFHYVDTQFHSELSVLVFGYERCRKDKLRIGPQKKSNFIFHYVLSGQGHLQIEERKYLIGRDQIFFIPAETIYSYYPETSDPWEYVWIEFSGIQAKYLCEKADFTESKPIYKCGSEKIRTHFLSLLDCPNGNLALNLHALSSLFKLLSLLIEQRNPESSAKSKQSYMIQMVQSYIESNYMNHNLTLKNICSTFYMSESYLSRIFTEVTGIPLSKYIMTLRMQKARELLMTKKFSIKDITFMVGYSDPHYFATQFKKFTGTSPSQYSSVSH